MAVEAIWNDQVIAHSDETVVVEGNHYFPRADVDPSVLEKSPTTSECPWKGTAHYYTIDVDGDRTAVRTAIQECAEALPFDLANLIAGTEDAVAAISLIVRR